MSRILVVDDEIVTREHFARALRLRGHAVVEAQGGAAAVAALIGSFDRPFEAMLLDLVMDDGDGFEVLLHCQAMIERPKIVAMSSKGNPSSDYLRCALACGADLALTKGEPLALLVGA